MLYSSAFGVRGEVRLKSFCAVPEAIADFAPLVTEDGRSFGVTLIRPLQGAFAGLLHLVGDQLVLAARLVQRDIGADQHLLPVLRTERHAAVAVAEHRAAHLGVIVF